MAQVQTALGAILRDPKAKEMPCGVFGSFGWSGEAVDELEKRLKVQPPWEICQLPCIVDPVIMLHVKICILSLFLVSRIKCLKTQQCLKSVTWRWTDMQGGTRVECPGLCCCRTQASSRPLIRSE